MQMTISGCIRQLRRQQGMTQTELGGEHFSKSYVSAVEREKIVPSYEALRFFAEQLDQSFEYFKQLAEQPVPLLQSTTQQVVSSLSFPSENDEQDESNALLDMVLEGTELPYASFAQEIATLSWETLMRLPLQKQARYCVMKGLILQEQGDFEGAHPLLERALGLSPMKYQPAILDALGTNSALSHTYQTALSYHRRALLALELGRSAEKLVPLRLKVELHCADDYRALGIHVPALEHYEHARQFLRSTSNMEVAGQVYMGLGYCTYASIYQPPGSTMLSHEEKERLLQQAVSFVLQGRTLYQVSSNQMGESNARLLHATILLALCALRYCAAQERARGGQPLQSLQCANLLDEAEEQCRQVLLNWNESVHTVDLAVPALEVILYSALSSLVTISVQRAAAARLEGYSDTALSHRAHAASLCQRILDTLTNAELLRSLVSDALALEDADMYRIQALPRLPDFAPDALLHHPMSLIAIFSASGEVAEELGRVATTVSYASDCYTRTNACFTASLHIERQSTFSKEHDVSSLARNYQRCITLMEERLHAAPELAEETYQALLALCKDGMCHLS